MRGGKKISKENCSSLIKKNAKIYTITKNTGQTKTLTITKNERKRQKRGETQRKRVLACSDELD